MNRKSERQDAYDKKNTVQFQLKLNGNGDRRIIDQLNEVPNKQGYIKKLIRNDISSGMEGRGKIRSPLNEICRVSLKLNKKTDADIIGKLQDVPNRQGYIKDLIYQDIEKRGGNDTTTK